jgi:hypothetical protein
MSHKDITNSIKSNGWPFNFAAFAEYTLHLILAPKGLTELTVTGVTARQWTEADLPTI